jgi:hypothetical protein
VEGSGNNRLNRHFPKTFKNKEKKKHFFLIFKNIIELETLNFSVAENKQQQQHQNTKTRRKKRSKCLVSGKWKDLRRKK